MIKEIVDLVPVLSNYPLWVRAVMLSLPPLYILALALLKAFEP